MAEIVLGIGLCVVLIADLYVSDRARDVTYLLTMVVLGLTAAPDAAALERLVIFAGEHDLARLSWSLVAGSRRQGGDLNPPTPACTRRAVAMDFSGIKVELPPNGFTQPTADGAARV